VGRQRTAALAAVARVEHALRVMMRPQPPPRLQVALGRFRVRRPLLWIKWMLWTTHMFSLGKFHTPRDKTLNSLHMFSPNLQHVISNFKPPTCTLTT